MYHTCPDGLHWNPEISQCTKPSEVDSDACPNNDFYPPGVTVAPGDYVCGTEPCANPPCEFKCPLKKGFYCDLEKPEYSKCAVFC